MNKKNNIKLFSTLLVGSLLLCACEKTCKHIDNDKDHMCDLCGEALSNHEDKNGDHVCDYCGAKLPGAIKVEFTGDIPEKLATGESVTLKAVATVVNDGNDEVTYIVDDTSLATISKNGVLSANNDGKEGTVRVTAYSVYSEDICAYIDIKIYNKGFDEEFLSLDFKYSKTFPYDVFKNFIGNGNYYTFEVPSDVLTDGVYYDTDDDFVEFVFNYEYSQDLFNKVFLSIYKTGRYGIASYSDSIGSDVIIDDTYTYGLRCIHQKSSADSKRYIALVAYKLSNLYTGSKEATSNTGWTTDDKALFKQAFGRDYNIPFFKLGSDYVITANSGYVTINDASPNYSCKNNILTEVKKEGSGWTAVQKDFSYKKDLDGTHYMLIAVSTKFLTGNTLAITVNTYNWPTSDIEEFLGTGSTVSIPETTGNSYGSYPLDYMGIQLLLIRVDGGDGNAYVDALKKNDNFKVTYYDMLNMYVATSKDCTVMMYISVGEQELVIQIIKTEPGEWPTEAISKYFDGRTTEEVPSIVGIDTYAAYDENDNFIIYMDSVEPEEYVEVLTSAGYTVTKVDSYTYVATSPEGTIKLTFGPGYEYDFEIVVEYVEVKPVITTWPEEDIKTALGEKTNETLLAAVGTEFELYTSDEHPGTATIYVKGSMSDYITALDNAGYTDEGTTSKDFIKRLSPGKTISLVISEHDDDWFYIDVTAHEAKHEEEGDSFPLEDVLACLELSSTYNLPIPTGTSFNLIVNGEKDCTIEVTGGDKAQFIKDVKAAGFIDGWAAGSYMKFEEDFYIDISGSSNENYSINYYIF